MAVWWCRDAAPWAVTGGYQGAVVLHVASNECLGYVWWVSSREFPLRVGQGVKQTGSESERGVAQDSVGTCLTRFGFGRTSVLLAPFDAKIRLRCAVQVQFELWEAEAEQISGDPHLEFGPIFPSSCSPKLGPPEGPNECHHQRQRRRMQSWWSRVSLWRGTLSWRTLQAQRGDSGGSSGGTRLGMEHVALRHVL